MATLTIVSCLGVAKKEQDPTKAVNHPP